MGSFRKHRALILTLDAFGTLFKPRDTISKQYVEVASKHGILGLHEPAIEASFRTAFKKVSKEFPNYGRAKNVSVSEWWSKVINATLDPFDNSSTAVRREVTAELFERFATDQGYELYSDVLPFFRALQQAKLRNVNSTQDSPKWESITVGLLSNSDTRLPNILKRLGLHVANVFLGETPSDQFDGEETHDIEFMALSYFANVPKPQRDIFDIVKTFAAERLGNKTHLVNIDFCHVGDELVNDAIAAATHGWKGVLVHRDPSTAKVLPELATETARYSHPHYADNASSPRSLSILKVQSLQALAHNNLESLGSEKD